ncbi:hypothetical protein EMCRGX_G008616 [Ephydatia muelleri]
MRPLLWRSSQQLGPIRRGPMGGWTGGMGASVPGGLHQAVHDFPAAGLLEAIDELRHQEYFRPRNFQEYRAGHQKQTLSLAICYKLWPCTTLLYTTTCLCLS